MCVCVCVCVCVCLRKLTRLCFATQKSLKGGSTSVDLSIHCEGNGWHSDINHDVLVRDRKSTCRTRQRFWMYFLDPLGENPKTTWCLVGFSKEQCQWTLMRGSWNPMFVATIFQLLIIDHGGFPFGSTKTRRSSVPNEICGGGGGEGTKRTSTDIPAGTGHLVPVHDVYYHVLDGQCPCKPNGKIKEPALCVAVSLWLSA